VATTRPASDVISIAFDLIAAVLVVVAIRAMVKASDAAKLPPARAAFEKWHSAWTHESIARSKKPTEEQTAAAFAEENPAYALTLRRYYILAVPTNADRAHTAPSKFIRNWGNKQFRKLLMTACEELRQYAGHKWS
jgi:hypothetical protein